MTDVILRPDFKAKPRGIVSGWLAGPDPSDTLPTARALSEIVERFSLNSAGVRAHASRAAMFTDQELHDKQAALAIEFARSTIDDLTTIIALLGGNEPESAA